MERGEYVNADRCNKIRTLFKGERIIYEQTHHPDSAKPGDILVVKVPKPPNLLIVPGSLALIFYLKVTDAHPVNNLAANIFSRIKVKINSTEIYDLDYSYLYNTYKDLWLTENQRINSVERGIQDEELSKLRACINVPDATSSNVSLRDIYGKRYIIPLNFELIDEHQPLPNISDEIIFELTVNKKENVLKYTKTETADFMLKNICIRYETLNNPSLYNEIERLFDNGTEFFFDHVQHYKRQEILKKDNLINEQINVDRRSLKGILLIFQNNFTQGQRDSECFVNPDIHNIRITIGTPNRLYDSGYKKKNHWPEIIRHFISEKCKTGMNSYMNILKYFSEDKYAIWIDLRSTQDNNLFGTGKKQDAKESITLEINKNNNGDGKYIMHIFVVSDARIKIQNKRFDILEK